MSDVIISVRGTAQRRVAPELAVVHAQVRLDGPDRASVTRRVGQSADVVRDRLKTLEEGERIVRWSSERAYFWSSRPWNQDGQQLPPVHYGSVSFSATFDDFSELAGWIGELAVSEEVSVGDVSWQLTRETRDRVERETATEAVSAAIERARAYAGALGFDDLMPLEIADHDLLTDGGHEMRAMMAGAARSAPAIELEPEDISISATVHGRFAAR